MKRIYLLVLSALFSVCIMAQDSGSGSSSSGSVTVNTTKSASTSFPWIWVVAGAVFLILLIALLSGRRGGTDTVVERKTIIKD